MTGYAAHGVIVEKSQTWRSQKGRIPLATGDRLTRATVDKLMEIAKSEGTVPATLANAFLELDDCLAKILRRLEGVETRTDAKSN